MTTAPKKTATFDHKAKHLKEAFNIAEGSDREKVLHAVYKDYNESMAKSVIEGFLDDLGQVTPEQKEQGTVSYRFAEFLKKVKKHVHKDDSPLTEEEVDAGFATFVWLYKELNVGRRDPITRLIEALAKDEE